MPLSVPLANVSSRKSKTLTRAMPLATASKIMLIRTSGQCLPHLMHRELPSDKLSPDLQDPHNVPHRWNAH